MAQVVCSSCQQAFESDSHVVPTLAAVAGGAAAGFVLGSGAGMLAGPFGAMMTSFPGAILGGTVAALGSSKFVKCPYCNQIEII